MDIRKLQRVIVNALEDVKAQDIKIFNSRKSSFRAGKHKIMQISVD